MNQQVEESLFFFSVIGLQIIYLYYDIIIYNDIYNIYNLLFIYLKFILLGKSELHRVKETDI